MPPASVDDFLDSTVGESAANQASKTKKDNYGYNFRFINVTTNSQQDTLHECPRRFQQTKIIRPGADLVQLTNLDFVYGHSVGAGVQTYIVTGNRNAALFAAFLSWSADLDSQIEKKEKAAHWATLAVLKFITLWDGIKQDWEVAVFNGRPASELSAWLDLENGGYHVSHIDVILRNKKTGFYTVVEIKTTSIRNVDESQYGNSGQSLGYSVILDAIVNKINEVNTFQVLYFVYATLQREWIVMPFTKSRELRADWLQDLLLDHVLISTYRKLNLFPKRGNACFSFNRRCAHYGVCDLKDNRRTDSFEVWKPGMDFPEPMDFTFKLSEVTTGI
jgi:hypothetical protein